MRFALFRGQIGKSIDRGGGNSTTTLSTSNTNVYKPGSHQQLFCFRSIYKAYRHAHNQIRLEYSLFMESHQFNKRGGCITNDCQSTVQ